MSIDSWVHSQKLSNMTSLCVLFYKNRKVYGCEILDPVYTVPTVCTGMLGITSQVNSSVTTVGIFKRLSMAQNCGSIVNSLKGGCMVERGIN